MPTRRPRPEFARITVRLPELRPWSTDASELAFLLRTLEAALVAMPAPASPEGEPTAPLSLVGVADGSNKLTLAVAPIRLAAFAALASSIATSNYLSLPPSAHDALHELSNRLVAASHSVIVTAGRSSGVARFEISASHPVPKRQPVPPLRGPSNLYGRCLSVGGAKTTRAELRLADGAVFTCQLASRELARELAKRLYEEVVLDGNAAWDIATGELLEFEAQRLTPFGPPPGESDPFAALRLLAGNRLDGVNPLIERRPATRRV